MKVVLFCGGQGLRIRDGEDVPKPMVHIGYRPILWHVMKYYAHFGHKDFILCLGIGPKPSKITFSITTNVHPTILYFPAAAKNWIIEQ